MRLKNTLLLFALTAGCFQLAAQEPPQSEKTWREKLDSLAAPLDGSDELVERLRNMPNIEVGKGISFEPQDKKYRMTMRFRMQNLLAFDFDKNFSHTAGFRFRQELLAYEYGSPREASPTPF